MTPINPRSGHAPGPSRNDSWYVRWLWLFLVAIVTVAEWFGGVFSRIAEILK